MEAKETATSPSALNGSTASIGQRFLHIRQHSENLCRPLQTEDYVVQPVVDVSPPKWHLAHTTWFFETFVLKPFHRDYLEFHPEYNFLFNSYYENIGKRTLRTDRGNLTRPTVAEVFHYRSYVNSQMHALLEARGHEPAIAQTVELGLQHEQQHQELLLTDIKYILGHNPLFPAYDEAFNESPSLPTTTSDYLKVPEGIHTIGCTDNGFCFDNELGVHRVLLADYAISPNLVTNGEYLEFMDAGGYRDSNHWLAEGWDWVNTETVSSPMYWHFMDGAWHRYALSGLEKVQESDPVLHLSYYEADAYARWKGERLPTEFEWEAASPQLAHGSRWEWTGSAYLAYPGFQKAEGAIGEYNGKFMVNQMVLRGGSIASPAGHVRPTYRNFFHPHLRWQFNGLRLAR